MKVLKAYREVVRKEGLTAKDGLCEFSLNSLISLAVRLFLLLVVIVYFENLSIFAKSFNN